MILILKSLDLFNDNILDSLNEIVDEESKDEKDKSDNNIDNKSINGDSSDESINNENDFNTIIKNDSSLTSEEIYLINGDMLILEKINKTKNKHKNSSKENTNMLNDLCIEK